EAPSVSEKTVALAHRLSSLSGVLAASAGFENDASSRGFEKPSPSASPGGPMVSVSAFRFGREVVVDGAGTVSLVDVVLVTVVVVATIDPHESVVGALRARNTPGWYRHTDGPSKSEQYRRAPRVGRRA